ncbi:MAG: hypothetical protein WB785_23875 [Mycobacterium sp.]|uniref:hypothetical protein n=1 Tax=Mycobacterium sp. TaxID=1785 RepID=UPI003C4772F6
MSRRIPLVAGIVFAVLFTCALLMVPILPGTDQPASAVISHFRDHADALRLQALLLTLGFLALVIVLAYARSRLDGPAGYAFTIGSALIIAEFSVELWFTSGLALHVNTLDPAVARTAADIALMFGPVLTVADVIVAVPIALAAKAGRFPRWLGVLAAIFALEQFVETVTIIGGPGLFISPGGPMNMFLGGALFIVFFLALGVSTSLTPDPATPSDA